MEKDYQRQAVKPAKAILSEMDWRDYPAPRWCSLKRVSGNCHKLKRDYVKLASGLSPDPAWQDREGGIAMTKDELWVIYVKAQQARNEALEACDKAQKTYLKAQKAYRKAAETPA